MSDHTIDPSILVAVRQEVEKLREQLKATGAASSRFQGAGEHLEQGVAQLVELAKFVIELASKLDALSQEVSRLDPGAIRQHLTDAQAKLVDLSRGVQGIETSFKAVNETALAVAKNQNSAQAKLVGLSDEIHRAESSILGEISTIKDHLQAVAKDQSEMQAKLGNLDGEVQRVESTVLSSITTVNENVLAVVKTSRVTQILVTLSVLVSVAAAVIALLR